MTAQEKFRISVSRISLSLLAASAFLLPLASSEAHIPASQTIVGRLVKNYGKGAYIIEQEVQFRTATEPVVLRERWLIENGENMRLSVSSPKAAQPANQAANGLKSDSTKLEGARFEAVYFEGKRHAPDLEGGFKSGSLTTEFLEGFFHARTSRGFNVALLRSRIVPGTFLRERPKFSNLKDVKYTPEPLVRLGRTSGVVTWVFGEPTPAGNAKLSPGVWIEQDAFLIRRLRFPSEAEVTADHHTVYAGTIRLPRERTVSWGTNSVLIRVLSVKPFDPKQVAKQLDPAAVSASAKTARLPDLEQVREFYTRFR